MTSLTARAEAVMPGGNARSTVYMPPAPPYAKQGQGCWIEDENGHRVIDWNNNYSALIHGHAFPPVLEAMRQTAEHGTAFGLPTVAEIELAELLSERAGLTNWRFMNSGTEAVMCAIRASRLYTGRTKVVRFEGSYHGMADAVVSDRRGVPDGVQSDIIVLPQGDIGSLRTALADYGDEIACVLIDLCPNRAGLTPLKESYVREVCELTRRVGSLLVVDEVITFRLGLAGLHVRYGVEPDLVAVGKIIGGGLPVGGLAGVEAVMDIFNPRRADHLSWGGTFSANPLTMSAGKAAMSHFAEDEIAEIARLGDLLRELLAAESVEVSGYGSLSQIHVAGDFAPVWWRLYQKGVFCSNNGLLCVSTAMSEDEVRRSAAIIAELTNG